MPTSLSTSSPALLPALPSEINQNLEYALPLYIARLPEHLSAQDIRFLASRGALSIPKDELRNELLKAYLHHVHAYMPMIDLEELLRGITQSDGAHQFSLLLFQAIMFAGVAFIDQDHLQAAGYPSRKSAREIFFEKTRLLFDFDCEMDHITLIQSLLLMTYWDDAKTSETNIGSWMGVTVSLAHSIGLHLDPETCNMGLPRQKMRKIVWWSLYARDRMLSLIARRPTQVNMDDCTVPLLTLDDFTLRPFPAEWVRIVGGTGFPQNIHEQRQLILIFIEKVKLCFTLGRVLSTQYRAFTPNSDSISGPNVMFVPIHPGEAHLCSQELESWLSNIAPEAHYVPPHGAELGKVDGTVHSARALLRVIYLSALIALYHQQFLPSTTFQSFKNGQWEKIFAAKLRSAAVNIIKTIHGLHILSLTNHHPMTFISLLIPAVVVHLKDVRSEDPVVRIVGLQRLYQGVGILQQLRDMHGPTGLAKSFTKSIALTVDSYPAMRQNYLYS